MVRLTGGRTAGRAGGGRARAAGGGGASLFLSQFDIIGRPSIGIDQGLVGLLDLEEALGIAWTPVRVRVKLKSGLAVTPTQLFDRGRPRHPEERVVVPLARHASALNPEGSRQG